jgi:hypothetical protein
MPVIFVIHSPYTATISVQQGNLMRQFAMNRKGMGQLRVSPLVFVDKAACANVSHVSRKYLIIVTRMASRVAV